MGPPSQRFRVLSHVSAQDLEKALQSLIRQGWTILHIFQTSAPAFVVVATRVDDADDDQ